MLRKAHISQPSIILDFNFEIMNASLELGNNENQIAIRLLNVRIIVFQSGYSEP